MLNYQRVVPICFLTRWFFPINANAKDSAKIRQPGIGIPQRLETHQETQLLSPTELCVGESPDCNDKQFAIKNWPFSSLIYLFLSGDCP